MATSSSIKSRGPYLGDDRSLAGRSIHELLELVALTLPGFPGSDLDLALLHLILPLLCCTLAPLQQAKLSLSLTASICPTPGEKESSTCIQSAGPYCRLQEWIPGG